MDAYCEIMRNVREALHLSQQDVALILGTTQQGYSRYESGTTRLPIRHLIALCNFYQISSDRLLGIAQEQA
ncbi:MAG: helix-turn-helix transcriptional regulator [Clostridia bacterium]